MSADDRLADEVRGLVRALRRNAPQRDWGPAEHRDTFERAAASRAVHPEVTVAGTDVCGTVTAEVHTPPELRGGQTVLYLHGGGFIMGSLATSRPMASHLAATIGRQVVVADYSLAPEARFPRQLHQALACYRRLQDSSGGPVVLLGDSAGAALCVGVAQRLAQPDRPEAMVLLSPFLDLRLTADSIDANDAYDPQTPRWLLEQMVGCYLDTGVRRDDPAVSPVLGDLSGLPPTLVQTAELECLVDDAISFERAGTAQGSPVELEVWPGMIHVWHLFAPRLRQANEAMQRVGEWLDGLNPQDGAAARSIRS